MARPKKLNFLSMKHTLSYIQFKNETWTVGLIDWIDAPAKKQSAYIRYYDLLHGLEFVRGRSNFIGFAAVHRWPHHQFKKIYVECRDNNVLAKKFSETLDRLGFHNDFIGRQFNDISAGTVPLITWKTGNHDTFDVD